jgi:hypothetical protein
MICDENKKKTKDYYALVHNERVIMYLQKVSE